MDKYSIDSNEDIVTAGTDLSGLSEDKMAMLKAEKEKAVEMVKIASFDGRFQDPYPSPFLNLSDTQIPRSTIEIFRWCKYFYMFDPLISGAINALATFPVTEIYLEDRNDKDTETEEESDTLKAYKRVLFKNLNIYKTCIEIGIDYYLYGNCFVFGEMWENPVTHEMEWKSITRLDPSKMIIDYNPATHTKKYKWTVPTRIAEIVRKKRPKEEYDKIPDIIKEAVRKNQAVVLNSENIYHFARATDSMGDNSVWGTPVIANVLKLLMYRNILRQAQEAIAREHIVPMRVYYLERTNDYNIHTDFNAVANAFAQELNKSVRDPNHKVVSPVPVNVINIGGEGKALLLTPEIQQVQEEILAGMNVPREFIFGGVSYSGSSISLKILENQFITYRLLLSDFLQNFVIKNMAKARKEWINEKDDDSLLAVHFQDLKMQDDVQQKQLIIQLNGAGKVTNEFMWKTIGIDPDKMRDALKREAIAAVETERDIEIAKAQAQLAVQKVQLEVQMQLQIYQAMLQKQAEQQYPGLFGPQLPQGGGGGPMPGAGTDADADQGQPAEQAQQPAQQVEQPQQNQQQTQPLKEPGDEGESEIQKVALQLLKLPAKVREQAMQGLPESAKKKIMQKVMELEGARQGAKQTEIDMRPMPEKLPPRRDSLK